MIGFHLELRPVLAQRMTLVCPVCRRERDEEAARRKEVEIVVYGASAYAICCCCGQEVRAPKDRNYRYRFRRWAKRYRPQAGADNRKGDT